MINQTMNATGLGQEQIATNVLTYFGSIPKNIISGNIIAIVIALVVFFILMIIISALSHLLLSFLKRTIMLLIMGLIIADFVPRYIQLIQQEGFTMSNVVIGVFAAVAGTFGIYLAVRSFLHSAKHHVGKLTKKMRDMRLSRNQETMEDQLRVQKELEVKAALEERDRSISALGRQQESLRQMFTKESMKNEKSLLAVLIYLVVAEFGVFSSPTLSAPNIQVGMMFFLIFLVGIVIFTRSSYKDTKTAATYFGVTFFVGLFLSFILGMLWGNITLQQLLSPEFFTSDSLVAMITGMGVSLFAGSKG